MKLDLTKYTPLLHKIAGVFPKKYREDLVQEGYILLYDAYEKYNPTMGTKFISYAYKSVYYGMNDYVKSMETTISLDNIVQNVDGESDTYADLLVDESMQVELDYENKDYYDKNLLNSSAIETFIKKRYFEEEFSVREIIHLYHELHMIYDYRTINKILKK